MEILNYPFGATPDHVIRERLELASSYTNNAIIYGLITGSKRGDNGSNSRNTNIYLSEDNILTILSSLRNAAGKKNANFAGVSYDSNCEEFSLRVLILSALGIIEE